MALSFRDSLDDVPRFLELAAGMRQGEPVVVSFYGGEKSRHLRWRPKEEGGGALPVIWDDSIRDEVKRRIESELKEGRQLGFIAGHGGSKKEQITHVNALRAEIDLPDSHELQFKVFAAVEKQYSIQFTLLDTGGKSIHAWVPLARSIPADQYKATSELWHQRITEVAKDSGIELPEGALDEACHRTTQVMRLPGSIHRKTGRVAKVVQWGDGLVELEHLGLDWSSVEAWNKRTAGPRFASKKVIARSCQRGEFLGFTGNRRFDELVSLAKSVPLRVPGTGTYNTVLTLVASLSTALGAEQAARVLNHAGHRDKQGNASIDGLRRWCETFEHDPENAPDRLAWLADWAERNYQWQRPLLPVSGGLEATELVAPTPGAISDSLFNKGGGLLVCRTGTGKTEGAVDFVDRMNANWRSTTHEFSVVVITPRRTINSQVAARLKAVNVSGQLQGRADPFRQPDTQINRYVCCLPSLGNPAKRNGSESHWGDYWSLGDTGMPKVYTGRGALATVLVLDEMRQLVTDLLLSHSGPGTLWESPGDRWRAAISLVRTIQHAGIVLAMDAQAGKPEQELLQGIGRIEASRVVGCPTAEPTRTMRWTSIKNRWLDCLLGFVKIRTSSEKPLLVVTGAKGKEGQGRRGLSARGLRDSLTEGVPGLRVLIIDAESKDTRAARLVLRGEVNAWDVVICTPVAQSGVSWVGAFAETVFVAGGSTLPPNICGGQAGRRERTATTCVTYIPKTTWDDSLPILGREEEEIRAELEQAREQALDLALARGPEVEIIIRVYMLAAKRQMDELSLFRDYTLHYATLDGWATEELEAISPLPRQKSAEGKLKKRTEPIAYDELNPWSELLVRSLLLLKRGALREVNETRDSALRETRQAKVGSAGADLISANLDQVQDLLLNSGLAFLCDGTFRYGDDSQVRSVAEVLQNQDARRVLRQATWLRLDLKGSIAYPAQTVGAVVSRLGGISNSRKRGPRGSQKKQYQWVLPGDL
jgi:hypothetical protein